MMTTDDLEMLKEARKYLKGSEREGSGLVHLPIWLVEALIEKAQRVHD